MKSAHRLVRGIERVLGVNVSSLRLFFDIEKKTFDNTLANAVNDALIGFRRSTITTILIQHQRRNLHVDTVVPEERLPV